MTPVEGIAGAEGVGSPGGRGDGVRMVFTTRAGGTSAGAYDSFNLGDHVGDDPVHVAENRARLARSVGLGPDRIVWMEQVHSRTVVAVRGPVDRPIEVADGLVTDRPNLALAVVTADCVPLLMFDPAAGVLGAVHAGRIGARIGIVPRAVEAMVELGAKAERMRVLLGPAACGGCYEVPGHMQADVEAHLPGSACRTRAGTAGLDLRAGIERSLRSAGVVSVAADPRCTIEDAALFSYRREGTTGRLAGLIWRTPQPGGAP